MTPSLDPDLHPDLELAVRAVRAAGEEVMRFFRREAEVRYKTPTQPVTGADFAADRLLAELLRGERPAYGWLSEETADSPERLGKARVWVVDPIDGTRAFIEGRAEFGVSVGLVEDGRVVLGVVYNPAAGELYHAVAGRGAFRDGEPLRMPEERAPRRKVLIASRSDLRRGEFAPFAEEWEMAPLGSTTYKMVAVAEGRADAYVSRWGKGEWDVCAAELVVREAGGRVTDAAGEEFRYNRPDPSVCGVIAARPEVFAEIRARVAALPPRGSS